MSKALAHFLKVCWLIPVKFESALIIFRMPPRAGVADRMSCNSCLHVPRDRFHNKLPNIIFALPHNILPWPPRPMSGLSFPGSQVAKGRTPPGTPWRATGGNALIRMRPCPAPQMLLIGMDNRHRRSSRSHGRRLHRRKGSRSRSNNIIRGRSRILDATCCNLKCILINLVQL